MQIDVQGILPRGRGKKQWLVNQGGGQASCPGATHSGGASSRLLLNCGAGGQQREPIHSEGNQPRVLTGRTDLEAEAPILWPSHEKRRLPGKDPDVGKV